MIYHLAYFSNSTERLSVEQMEKMLVKFRQRNQKRGITGILLYLDRCFLQIIEGTKEGVEGLFNIIKDDPRHDEILRIFAGKKEERTFKDWSMGFEVIGIEKFKDMAGFNNLSNEDFIEQVIKTNHPRVVRTLKVFYTGGLT